MAAYWRLPRDLRLAATLAIALSAINSSARAENLPTVAKYEAWRGGGEFQKLAGFNAVGTLSTSGLSGTIDVSSEADSQSRQRVDLGAFKQDNVLNGDAGWSKTLSGAVTELPAAEVTDAVRDNALLYDGVLHRRLGAVLAQRPSEMLNGTACDVIRVTYGGSASIYDYLISPTDGRLIAIRSFVAGVTQLTAFDDWRMVNGVRMPFAEHVFGDKPSDASTTIYTHIDINPHLAAGLFSAPVEAKPVLFAKGITSNDWLPFEFFDHTRIFIPATVNGRRIAVMLDSGASSNVVDRRFADSLGLKAQGNMTAQGAGGASTAGVINGVNLTLGALTFRNSTAVAIDLANIERRLGHPLPMILGGEAFTDCVVDIDFLHHRIAFRNPGLFQAPAGVSSVALTQVGEARVLHSQVEGRPASLVFDIGNAGALVLFPRFWNVPGFLAGRRTSTTQTGGLGGTSVVKLTMITALSVGGTSFGGVPTTLEDTRSAMAKSGRLDGNLGLPVYSRFRLIVDEPHNRVLFAPPVDTAAPFEVSHAGLSLQSGPSGSEVLYVAPGSPGEAAGLKIHDMIVTVDGVAVGRAYRGGRPYWVYGRPGTKLKIGLASGHSTVLTLGTYF